MTVSSKEVADFVKSNHQMMPPRLGFFSLPREVRDMIYTIYFEDKKIGCHVTCWYEPSSLPAEHVALFLTSKQMYSEAQAIMYNKATFRINPYNWWVDRTPDEIHKERMKHIALTPSVDTIRKFFNGWKAESQARYFKVEDPIELNWFETPILVVLAKLAIKHSIQFTVAVQVWDGILNIWDIEAEIDRTGRLILNGGAMATRGYRIEVIKRKVQRSTTLPVHVSDEENTSQISRQQH